jgi:hypothetical protein
MARGNRSLTGRNQRNFPASVAMSPNEPIARRSHRRRPPGFAPQIAASETGRLHFVGRNHELLEDQLCTWVEGEKSPDRLDAAAHAVNTLLRAYTGPPGDFDPERYGAVPYSDRPVAGGAVPWR